MRGDDNLTKIHQKRLLEDLGHAHAHNHEQLRDYAHQGASEIRRLQRELDRLRSRSFFARLFNRG